MTSRYILNRMWVVVALACVSNAIAQDTATVAYSQVARLDWLSMPSDVAVGNGGHVYVVDGGNHQVAVFDPSGGRLTSFGMRGDQDGQLESPVGIAVSRNGEIYVADKGNRRLVRFDADGRVRQVIELEEDGQEAGPVDVAVSHDGEELFVTMSESHRVLVYSRNGELLRTWGGEGEAPGQFRYPATIALDRAGNVYVVDVLNSRVQKFDADGQVIATIGERGGKPGTFFRPKGVAVDATGRIYVSDSYLGVVQVLDPEGEFLYLLGDEDGARIFETPVGMTFADSRLLVVEMLPGRVQVLEVRP